MFPSHPHAAAWNKKAIEYMMNTLSVQSDLSDNHVVDGRPVNEWVRGTNLYPEFTLENHSIFHPAYLECSTYLTTQSAMHCVYGHHAIPQAVDHHLKDTWNVLKTIMLPCGESAFPQGMDWEIHGLPNINLLATFATYKKDSMASEKEKIVLQRIRTWQKMQNGNLAVPGSPLGFTRHAIVAEQVAYGLVAHKLFGSPSSETSNHVAAPLECVRHYPSIEVSIHRTADKFFSFSWKNRIMGMLIPIGTGFENSPHFTVPVHDGFVGSIETSAGNKSIANVVDHTYKELANGFETAGTLHINGDRIEQTIRISAVGERIVVYQDHVRALTDVTVSRELGVPLGIENDELSGGQRILYYQDGKKVLDWHEPSREIEIPGTWVNVDSRLAVIKIAGAGLSYKKANGYNAQAVCADILYGSFLNQRRKFKAGDEIAHRIILCAVDISPEQTEALIKSSKVQHTAAGKELRFDLLEGGEAKVKLQ
jgi:hypothetical protein